MKKHEYQTIYETFIHTAQANPSKVVVEFGKTAMTWAQLSNAVDDAAQTCYNMGIRKGSHVALWCTNSIEFIVYYLALEKSGAVAILYNTSWVADEIRYATKQTDVEFFLCGRGSRRMDYAGILCRILKEEGAETAFGELKLNALPKLRKVMYIGTNKQELLPTAEDYEGTGTAVFPEVEAEDLSTIIFTSGTTSRPKGVMHCHAALVNNAFVGANALNITSEDRFCVPLPMFHCFSLITNLISTLIKGACLDIPTQDESKALAEFIARKKCTVLHAVPTLLLRLANDPEIEKYDLSSIRTGIVGGASYSIEQYTLFCEKIPFDCLMSSVGQSEAAATITMIDPSESFEVRATTVGGFVDGVEGKIVDIQTGEALPEGQVGEICIKSEMVMLGYYNQKELTESVIDKDGWLHCGDLGKLDEKGNLTLCGRLKDIVIRGGENISLLEVEHAILSHPAVSEVKTLGVPDEMMGEEICACVVAKPGMTVTIEELKAHIHSQISYYKVPKFIIFIKELPKTSTGKVKIQDLTDIALKRIK